MAEKAETQYTLDKRICDTLSDLAVRFIRDPGLVVATVQDMPRRLDLGPYKEGRFKIEYKCFDSDDPTGIDIQYDASTGCYTGTLFYADMRTFKGVFQPDNSNIAFACCLLKRIIAEKKYNDKRHRCDKPDAKPAEELEPGVWHQFDQVHPNRASEFGYLVILPETRLPVPAQFDDESKRFKVFCPQIGKDIQVPVTMWFEVPNPSK